MAQHRGALTLGLERRFEGASHACREIGQPRPVGRRLERVRGDADVEQRVAQVGVAEAVGQPASTGRGAERHPAVSAEQCACQSQAVTCGVAVARSTVEHEAGALRDAAQPKPAPHEGRRTAVARQAERHRHLGLGLVGEPQQRERHSLLKEVARRLQAAQPARQQGCLDQGPLGPSTHTNRGVRDDPEAPFAAGNELAQVRSRRSRGQGGQLEPPGRRHEIETGDEVLDRSVAQRLLARSPRRDPATQARQLERLGEVAEREATLRERRLDLGTQRARAEARDAGLLVELLEAHQPTQIEADRRVATGQYVDCTGDGRSASPGYDAHALSRTALQHLLHLGCVAGTHHGVGQCGLGAAANADQIGESLATRVSQASLVLLGQRRVELRNAPR